MKKIALCFFVCFASFSFSQLPSFTFEGTWPPSPFGAAPDPAGWLTTNVLTSPFISTSNPTTTTQHTLSCEGSMSMRIETKTFVTTGLLSSYIPTVAGFGVCGQIQSSPSFALRDGFPYTTRPNSISYCYIAQPQPQDTAGVRVLLWKYTGSSRNIIGFAQKTYTSSNASFQTETLTIAYNSTVTPDSMGIYVASSFKFPSSGFTIRDGAKAGSVLILDNIMLNVTSLQDYTHGITFHIYPNPASDYVYINSSSMLRKKISIQDITGKIILRSELEDKILLYTGMLPEGIYFINLSDEHGKLLSSQKLQILH